jgi:hypothetical protein
MFLQQGVGPASWPAAAVHDTVAAIAREPAYLRSLRETLLRRIVGFISRMFDDLFDLFRASVTGREVTIALLVLLGVLIVARLVVASQAAREDVTRADGGAQRGRSSDPWSDAERLAASGRFTEAAHALLAALLSAFAARGEVRLHASKTAGDYARELLRRGSPAQSGFQAFRRRYDRIIYGVGECTAEEYAALLHDARPLLLEERAA